MSRVKPLRGGEAALDIQLRLKHSNYGRNAICVIVLKRRNDAERYIIVRRVGAALQIDVVQQIPRL